MQLIGVSFPRSGHHFLVRLLRAALHDDFSYCEFYGPVGCCRAIPCTRPTARVHLQKNHDFELAVPQNLADCLYVVQYREPVGAAVSDREFYARVEGAAVGASRQEYEVWLGRKAAHYFGFSRRWLQTPPDNSVVIDYADLTSDPVDTVLRLLVAAGMPVARDAVQAAADGTARVGDFGVVDGFAPRPTDERAGFDGELLARFESLIIDELPELALTRQLASIARDPEHIFEIAYAAAAAEMAHDPAAELAAIDRGLAISPQHPLLLHWRGRIAWRVGDLPLARRYCAQAVEQFPDHPLLRVELAQIAHAQGDLVTARIHAEALRGLREPDPGHEVHLAMVLAELGDRDAALEQIARAHARRPTEPAHWVYLVRAATAVDAPVEARQIAADAVAIWPLHPDVVASARAAGATS